MEYSYAGAAREVRRLHRLGFKEAHAVRTTIRPVFDPPRRVWTVVLF